MIPLPWIAGGTALAMVLAAFGGWTVRGWKADSDQLIAVTAADAAKAKAEGVVATQATQLELLRAAHDQNATVVQGGIREVYHEIKVPAECAVPDAALRLLDSALANANAEAAGQPSSPVPPVAPTPAGHD